MIKTIQDNWLEIFKKELSQSQSICIVSPFITDNIVKQLINFFKGSNIKVVTRYNLNDFKKGVSSLSAIERLLNAKSQIKSVKNLHSKLYLFDEKSVIITSANFTNGGFFNNKEFGILTDEYKTVIESSDYFDALWEIDSKLLELNKVNEWKGEIEKSYPIFQRKDVLPDYSASYQESIIKNKRYFIKFFGKDDNRLGLEAKVLNELEGGCSHFALSFSRNKKDTRPRRYRKGDIVFMARMTNTQDYAIFGRAITYAHNDRRDVANQEDINNIPWLKDWSILIRVKEPIYINSTLKECPKLNDLLNNLDYDSFASTKRRFDRGERNINPRNTLMQKGDVILSNSGAQWMELAFQKAIDNNGKIDEKFINKLYQGLNIDNL
jgi:hypothetical protein